MAKALPERFAPPDDPMFLGGFKFSSRPQSSGSSRTSQPATGGEMPATSTPTSEQSKAAPQSSPERTDPMQPFLDSNARLFMGKPDDQTPPK